MRIAELLIAIAQDLESSENEALLLSEYDENCLNVVASSLVEAAAVLKKAANEVDAIEPVVIEPTISPESLDEVAEFATALDQSGDPLLKKQAALIDELLLTVAAPPNYVREKKAEEDARIETLRAKYQGNAETLKEENKTAQQQKDVAKSEYLETMPIYAGGSQRNCPDHIGVQTYKLEGSDQTYVCSLDHKHYDYLNGYTLLNGQKVPGRSVSNQTGNGDERFYQPMFDSREGRLQSNR